jgi:hypothetical protein
MVWRGLLLSENSIARLGFPRNGPTDLAGPAPWAVGAGPRAYVGSTSEDQQEIIGRRACVRGSKNFPIIRGWKGHERARTGAHR